MCDVTASRRPNLQLLEIASWNAAPVEIASEAVDARSGSSSAIPLATMRASEPSKPDARELAQETAALNPDSSAGNARADDRVNTARSVQERMRETC
jgi:hypothetical protein